MTRFKTILLAILLTGFVLQSHCNKPVTSSLLPDVELKDLAGKPVRLQDFSAKPLIINFWATWCGPCRFEIPMLNELHRKYASSELVILGVSTDEGGSEVVEAFMKDVPIYYPVFLETSDAEAKFGGIWGLPTTFFYDKNGNQVGKAFGLQSRDFFEQKIGEIIR